MSVCSFFLLSFKKNVICQVSGVTCGIISVMWQCNDTC